jgi:hypothetical protein
MEKQTNIEIQYIRRVMVRIYYLFIYFVVYLHSFFSNLDYITQNERVINEWRIEKDVDGSGRGLI